MTDHLGMHRFCLQKMFLKSMLMAYCYWIHQPRLSEPRSMRFNLFIGDVPPIPSKPDVVNAVIPMVPSLTPKGSSLSMKKEWLPSIFPQTFDLIYIENQSVLRQYSSYLIQSLKPDGKLIVQEYDDALLLEIWSFEADMMETYFPHYGQFLDSRFHRKRKFKHRVIYSHKK